MSLNNLKKMIIFSTQNIRSVIEGFAADEAVIEKRSASSIIENHILNDILPENKDASYFCRSMYDEAAWSVSECLKNIFSYMAAGVNWKAKHKNGFEIVNFAYKLACQRNYRISSDKKEIYHFRSAFDAVNVVIQEKCDDTTMKKWSSELLKSCQAEEVDLESGMIILLIINNWHILGDYTYTYRMLTDIFAMAKDEKSTAEDRIELVNILKDVSKEWD